MATLAPVGARSRRWMPHAILSGFAATICMGLVLITGFVLASNIGSQSGGTVQQWFWGLSHNHITSTTQNYLFVAAALYLSFGLVWAVIYALLFEPLLDRPGWQEGLAFSMFPFVLSELVFLPSLGGGVFGNNLGSGPLPILGNFILHVVYGVVLGSIYNTSIGGGEDEEAEEHRYQHAAMQGAERYGAIGILAGIACGALLGSILGSNVYPPTALNDNANLITGMGELSLAGAVLGAGLGALLGSMLGLSSLPEGGDL